MISAKELTIDLNYEFDAISYVPIRNHRKTGFVKITYANIEIRWPIKNEIKLIWERFENEAVYRAFGYSQPPLLNHIAKSELPDLTTGEKKLEPVEFLTVQDRDRNKWIGFCVVYEAKTMDDPDQELDFTIASEDYLGMVGMIRTIEISILSYLFAVRGAKSVFWIRRKPAGHSNRTPESQNVSFKQKGRPIVITRPTFRQRLKRFIEREGTRAGPVLSLSD